MSNSKGYVASSEPEWNYIGIDEEPPSGKINVLTEGGMSVNGTKTTQGMIAWAPLLKRNKAKEALLARIKDLPEAEKAEAIAAYKESLKTKHCTMNCSPGFNNPKSFEQLQAECNDCTFY